MFCCLQRGINIQFKLVQVTGRRYKLRHTGLETSLCHQRSLSVEHLPDLSPDLGMAAAYKSPCYWAPRELFKIPPQSPSPLGKRLLMHLCPTGRTQILSSDPTETKKRSRGEGRGKSAAPGTSKPATGFEERPCRDQPDQHQLQLEPQLLQQGSGARQLIPGGSSVQS